MAHHGERQPALDSPTGRRQVLRYLGGVGAVLLAGCPDGKSQVDARQDGAQPGDRARGDVSLRDDSPRDGGADRDSQPCGECSGTCSGLCGGNCKGGCDASCVGTCRTTCLDSCTATCAGSCIGTCVGGGTGCVDCAKGCVGGCKSTDTS
jgi:hypothetical protein